MAALMSVLSVACADPAKNVKNLKIEEKTTIHVWYDDSRYTSYMEYVEQQLEEANELLDVELVYTDKEGYMDDIYQNSVHPNEETTAADVYLLHGKDMQKAYLSGIITKNDTYAGQYTEKVYGKAALSAASYGGTLYGYPLTFHTSVMVYNKGLASQMNTFEELTQYSNQYQVNDANQNIQLITTWDVSDPFVNYAFGAKAINIGGDNGEDASVMESNQPLLQQYMQGFYQLKGAYGLDDTQVDENYCVDKFTQGRLLYTIIDSDRLQELDQSGIEYGICAIPAMNQQLPTQALSETDMFVVNPYAKQVDSAKAVAQAFSYDYADAFYSYSGCSSARNDLKQTSHSDEYKTLHDIYADSQSIAKFVGADEYYLRYELLIHDIWAEKGVDASVTNFMNMIQKNQIIIR